MEPSVKRPRDSVDAGRFSAVRISTGTVTHATSDKPKKLPIIIIREAFGISDTDADAQLEKANLAIFMLSKLGFPNLRPFQKAPATEISAPVAEIIATATRNCESVSNVHAANSLRTEVMAVPSKTKYVLPIAMSTDPARVSTAILKTKVARTVERVKPLTWLVSSGKAMG
jgi:hypothetical protein